MKVLNYSSQEVAHAARAHLIAQGRKVYLLIRGIHHYQVIFT